jgi:hypothetical protein
MVPGQNQGLSIQIFNSSGQIYCQSKRGLTPEGEGTTVGTFTLGVKDPSIKCPNTNLFI